MARWNTLGEAAVAVLMTEKARTKAEVAREVAKAWREGELNFVFDVAPPDRPARPDKPVLLPPADMPKRRKAGTENNRRALLHAVAHIELNAIDLAFDIVARFGSEMPRAFADDWVRVGDDEARHFTMVASRLKALDSFYGDLPAHDGLWQSSVATKESLPARLAVVPMVLEARGLDVTPHMIKLLENAGDTTSAEVLKTVYKEEVSHVAAGTRWFKYLSEKENQNPDLWFQTLVKLYFHGQLKPPFNKPARSRAGMAGSFYEPLAGSAKAG